jgi:cytochrome c6
MKKIILMVILSIAAQAGAQTVDGKTVFAKNCAACHQANGAGISGVFPALKGNAFVQGGAGAVIETVLKGRAGMPTFATALDDEQLATVLSYIRQSWGNTAAAISGSDVKTVRNRSSAGEAVKEEKPTNVN